jgi:RHS repeat-associated protein
MYIGKIFENFKYVAHVAHVEQTGNTANGETQEQVFYPLSDHVGQPMMMVRADEKISHEQYTDPYGKMYSEYIDTSLGIGPQPQDIGLPGQYRDAESNYSYNWNRYYDPETGSYLQSDLIGQQGGINTFLYAGANPVMNSDFAGLKPGDTFDSIHAAAQDAWDYVWSKYGPIDPRSPYLQYPALGNNEFFAWITKACSDGNTQYTYSEPVAIGPYGGNSEHFMGLPPEPSDMAGEFHSHGQRPFPANDPAGNTKPSMNDINRGNDYRSEYPGWEGWMGYSTRTELGAPIQRFLVPY